MQTRSIVTLYSVLSQLVDGTAAARATSCRLSCELQERIRQHLRDKLAANEHKLRCPVTRCRVQGRFGPWKLIQCYKQLQASCKARSNNRLMCWYAWDRRALAPLGLL
jgi:hypothetical protein